MERCAWAVHYGEVSRCNRRQGREVYEDRGDGAESAFLLALPLSKRQFVIAHAGVRQVHRLRTEGWAEYGRIVRQYMDRIGVVQGGGGHAELIVRAHHHFCVGFCVLILSAAAGELGAGGL